MGKVQYPAAGNGQSAGQQITAIAKSFQSGATAKSAHLVNLALATLKYLLMNSESDDIRYQAATALLGLPPMQAKLGLMRTIVDQPYLGREHRPAVIAKRLKAVMEQSPEQLQRLLALVAEAEKEGQSPTDSGSKAA